MLIIHVNVNSIGICLIALDYFTERNDENTWQGQHRNS